MECQPPGRIGSRTVFEITDDRMVSGSQLNPDLVLTSAFKRELEQRPIPIVLQHPIMRDCQVATLINAMNP